jgi:hypothetical protein
MHTSKHEEQSSSFPFSLQKEHRLKEMGMWKDGREKDDWDDIDADGKRARSECTALG